MNEIKLHTEEGKGLLTSSAIATMEWTSDAFEGPISVRKHNYIAGLKVSCTFHREMARCLARWMTDFHILLGSVCIAKDSVYITRVGESLYFLVITGLTIKV